MTRYALVALMCASAGILSACSDASRNVAPIGDADSGVASAKPVPVSHPTAAIAFLANQPNGSTRVAVIDADGGNQVTISNSSAGFPPSWSGSGVGTTQQPWKMVYNTTYSSFTTVDVDTSGGSVNVRNPRSFSYGTASEIPRWMPGRDSIAFSTLENLMVVGASGGAPALLYTEAGRHISYSAWRTDGSAIAFAQYYTSGGSRFALRVLNRSSGAVTTIVEPGAMGDIFQIDWTRTRDEIAFTTHRGGEATRSTWVVSLIPDADGNLVAAAAPRLVSSAAGWPSWSPDDSKLVIAGLRVVDYATGAVLGQFSNGGAADWRR